MLLDLAPTFGQHGAKAYTDRLVKYALEGNAWHADHVMPVHRGGGLCGLENLRTLCVLCHMVHLLHAFTLPSQRRAAHSEIL